MSNWGGRKAAPDERTDLSGYSESADHILVDARGVISSGTVSRIDLATGETTHSLEVGLHPTVMAWDEAHNRLYVASTNQDAVSVIGTTQAKLVAKIDIQPFSARVVGIAPTALVFAPDGSKLYVACGGINAVAVIDTFTRKIQGMIPTAWYPDAIESSPDGCHLLIAALLGHGSGWRDEPRRRYVHDNRGSIAVVAFPTPGATGKLYNRCGGK